MSKEKSKLTAEEKEAKKKAAAVAKTKLEDRRERALAMHIGGATYRQIAERLTKEGTPVGKTTVEKDINLLLDGEGEIDEKIVSRIRNVQTRRYNQLILANWAVAVSGNLKAGYFVRTLMKDLSELYGADAPVKIEQSGSVTLNKGVDLSNVSKDDLLVMEEILKKADVS